jgi:hydroxymethylglutaryl-CoA lyase
LNYDRLPESVSIFEVGPRDGFQDEPEFIATEKKIQFINMLTEAGCKRIEIGSFVHPKWVPQLKDIKEVFGGIEKKPGVTYSAFIPNMKGLEIAIETGLKEVVNIISASESHNKRNLNRTVAESLGELGLLVETTKKNGMKLRSYIGTSFGCPIEGNVPIANVVEIAKALDNAGAYEISLGDTTGMSNPALTHKVVSAVVKNVERASVALHVHSYKGIEFANILAGLQAGVRVFDGAAGGLGGCPYAPGATGNIATEWLVEIFEQMGISTGIDREKIKDCGLYAQEISAYSQGRKCSDNVL